MVNACDASGSPHVWSSRGAWPAEPPDLQPVVEGSYAGWLGAPTAIGVGQAGWRASSEGRHPTSAMKVGIDAPDPPAGGGDRARGTCAAWAAKERRLLAVLALHLGEAVGYDLDAAFGELGADPPARPFLAALAALAASRRRLHGRRRRRLRQGPRPRGTQQRPAVPLLPLVALPWPGR